MPSPPSPPVVVTPAWMQAALHVATVLAGIFGALFYGSVPHTTPSPAPGPNPAPYVVPLPIPSPSPDASGSLSITDSRSLPVTNNVDAGKIINVSCPEGYRVYGLVQPMPASGDISHISPTRLQVSLQPGGLVQIFMYNCTDTPTVTIVRCNQAPQPPPPIPTPAPVPAPVPQPSGKVIISIVEDAPNRPPYVVAVLNDFTFWEGLRKAGHSVKLWNGGATPSPEADAVADITLLQASSVPLAGIVIRRQSDKVVLFSGRLPQTAAETKALVAKYAP